MRKIFTGPFLIPLDTLEVSFMHHWSQLKSLQVSLLVPVGPVFSASRCRFCTTPTFSHSLGGFPAIHSRVYRGKIIACRIVECASFLVGLVKFTERVPA